MHGCIQSACLLKVNVNSSQCNTQPVCLWNISMPTAAAHDSCHM